MRLNRLFARPVRRAALALCAAAVLTACGGGDRSEPFVPGRIVALGDELSVLTPADATDPVNKPAGRKYAVNGFTTDTTTLNCGVNPIWIQTLANSFGMGFEQCPNGSTNLSASTRATVGATVSDVQQQVTTFLNDTTRRPADNDLVTILVGSNDVLNAYAAWDAAGRTDAARTTALASVKAQAQLLALQVKRLVDAGPAVLIATIPYLGVSPYAVAQGSVGQQMLRDLTDMFNNALQSSGQGDQLFTGPGLSSYGLTGKDYGLVQTGTSWINGIAGSSSDSVKAYNATPLCTVALPDCTPSTIVSGGDVNNWVWADTTRPGYAFHAQLGSRAATMAGPRGLPF
jgi:hypothetical protein